MSLEVSVYIHINLYQVINSNINQILTTQQKINISYLDVFLLRFPHVLIQLPSLNLRLPQLFGRPKRFDHQRCSARIPYHQRHPSHLDLRSLEVISELKTVILKLGINKFR